MSTTAKFKLCVVGLLLVVIVAASIPAYNPAEAVDTVTVEPPPAHELMEMSPEARGTLGAEMFDQWKHAIDATATAEANNE